MGTVVSVELQRTCDEIAMLARLLRVTMSTLIGPDAAWEYEGKEYERLDTIGDLLAWAQDPANGPPDNPYTLAGVEARVAAAVTDEGPYVTAERVAEIRHMERERVRTTAALWAERAGLAAPELRATLDWLLGGPCPVGEDGHTPGYRRRVA